MERDRAENRLAFSTFRIGIKNNNRSVIYGVGIVIVFVGLQVRIVNGLFGIGGSQTDQRKSCDNKGEKLRGASNLGI